MHDHRRIGDPVARLKDLDAACRERGLRYRWRTWQEDGMWHAEVQAGYADADWRPTGACPRWGGTGATEAEAMRSPVDAAFDHWTGRRA